MIGVCEEKMVVNRFDQPMHSVWFIVATDYALARIDDTYSVWFIVAKDYALAARIDDFECN